METVKIEKIIEETKYKAIDGTLFINKAECEKYETTCQCILNTKYKKYVIDSKSEYNIFQHGSEDYIYDVVKISDDKIKDIVLQLFILYNPNSTYYFEKITKTLESFAYDDYLLVGRDYNNTSFWPDNCSLKEHINHLNSFVDNIKENIF